MTFTTRIKEEVTSNIPSDIDARILLISYLKYATTLENNRLKKRPERSLFGEIRKDKI